MGRRRWRPGLRVLLLIAIAVVTGGGSKGEWSEEEQLTFLRSYWQLPIPLQGKAPDRFSPLEASLDPESCGVCHQKQYEEWKTSLHAKTMGPGPFGQTVDLIESDQETALICYSCHAPLTEQQEKHRIKMPQGELTLVDNPSFDQKLQRKGLVCAACHVRQHERFGPPKRDGTLASTLPRDQLPHNGVTRTPAFLRAEFCKECHQFPEDGYALNGKLLENTYNEWRASPYAKEGIQCQDCHMPDRKHLFRGIHDPEMVKKGVTIQLKTSKPRYRVGETILAALTVENTGVGHSFPTYVTPKVFIRAELIDPTGHPVPESVQEEVIGREVTLDLSREISDTRIPPKGTYTFKYAKKIDRRNLRLKVSVVVFPDYFYTRFFEAVLSGDQFVKGRKLLEEALEETRRSPFTIFEKEVLIS
ncbi:MAG: multiheme c-type cytochrome [Candidatus Methylomirabilales bacterium]